MSEALDRPAALAIEGVDRIDPKSLD